MHSKRIKITSKVTALALICSLGLSGCKSPEFEFTSNEQNEIVVVEDSYIDYEFLTSFYYVVEAYNTITKESELYIAFAYRRNFSSVIHFDNIFDNLFILYDDNELNRDNGLVFIKSTSLQGYVNSYCTKKYRYTYDEVKELYETIKENYEFEEVNEDQMRLAKTVS